MNSEFKDIKETVVSSLPKCDFCDSLAKFDAKTKTGPWANMCAYHFLMNGMGLGTGKGQKLIVREESCTS